MITSRRTFLTGLTALIAAPAIVCAASLMPVKSLPPDPSPRKLADLLTARMNDVYEVTRALPKNPVLPKNRGGCTKTLSWLRRGGPGRFMLFLYLSVTCAFFVCAIPTEARTSIENNIFVTRLNVPDYSKKFFAKFSDVKFSEDIPIGRLSNNIDNKFFALNRFKYVGIEGARATVEGLFWAKKPICQECVRLVRGSQRLVESVGVRWTHKCYNHTRGRGITAILPVWLSDPNVGDALHVIPTNSGDINECSLHTSKGLLPVAHELVSPVSQPLSFISSKDSCNKGQNQSDESPLLNPIWWIGVAVGCFGIFISIKSGAPRQFCIGVGFVIFGFFVAVIAHEISSRLVVFFVSGHPEGSEGGGLFSFCRNEGGKLLAECLSANVRLPVIFEDVLVKDANTQNHNTQGLFDYGNVLSIELFGSVLI